MGLPAVDSGCRQNGRGRIPCLLCLFPYEKATSTTWATGRMYTYATMMSERRGRPPTRPVAPVAALARLGREKGEAERRRRRCKPARGACVWRARQIWSLRSLHTWLEFLFKCDNCSLCVCRVVCLSESNSLYRVEPALATGEGHFFPTITLRLKTSSSSSSSLAPSWAHVGKDVSRAPA